MDKNNENYLKIRRAFYQQDMSKEKRYVDKMCDLYLGTIYQLSKTNIRKTSE